MRFIDLFTVVALLTTNFRFISGHLARHTEAPSTKLVRRQSDPWLRWCGKHYQAGSPDDSSLVEAGRTPVPPSSSSPLLDFRCTPTIQPYLDSDSTGSFLIDANITSDVGQLVASSSSTLSGSPLQVSIYLTTSTNTVLSTFTLPAGTTLYESSPFNLSSLPPSSHPYNVTCAATLSSTGNNQTFSQTTTVYRLPANPYGGSITKMDRRTGALLRESSSGTWQPFLPFGFYTNVADIITNMSIISDMANDGWNVIHLVPTYPNTTIMTTILDQADAAGILYVADFRDIYQTTSAIQPYIELFRSRKGLLAWYTADEPDGTNDPFNSSTGDYQLIYQMDGYHPVSLVLMCSDFYWNQYTAGADIVLSDTYPIAVNNTFSKMYGTVCNATYGCCGCDDCSAQLTDISSKFDHWSERRRWLGRSRDLAMWTVPQAFDGTTEFWNRVPTGPEFKLQTILGVNHGAVGIIPWDNPYPVPTLAQAAREIAPVFSQQLAPRILDHSSFRTTLSSNASGVDIASWSSSYNNTNQTLILLANLNYDSVVSEVNFTLPSTSGAQTLFGQGNVQGGKLVVPMESTGIAGFVVQHAASGSNGKKNGCMTLHPGGWNLVRLFVLITVMIVVADELV
ncbi:hypothetical protein JAAARDRAFT_36103 [Jaapia argillacea MUCL 33604]|uniref:Uncharacterized protein n=1 Tax=Jaapia argillacea MUCL 33604 TaxID=933084 RepID=A0A067Q1Z2_9AGAM|nr:hypothetical protein JAAARDRAFT_36103 [Jaapia argillacea MUCL 33604]